MVQPSHLHVRQGIWLMMRASVAFSVMALGVKVASQSLSPMQVVFLRSFLGLLMVSGMMWLTKASFLGANSRMLFLRGLSGFVALALNFYAITLLNLGTAIMLNQTAPIFVALLSATVLKERVHWITWVSILVAFVGVYLLVAPRLEYEWWGFCAGLASGFAAALAYLCVRVTRHEKSPYTIIFYFTFVSTLGSLGALHEGIRVESLSLWIAIGAIAFSSFSGQVLLTRSLTMASPSVLLPFGYLTSILGMVYGWVFWHERMSGLQIFGALLIIVGGAICFSYNARQYRRVEVA